MRNNLIDNAKGILIFLVVFGHFLEAVNGWGNPYLRTLLSGIYLLHMPAFIFLTGITAKQDRLGMRVTNIAVLLVMFQFAYVAPLTIVDGRYPVNALQPYWHLWFLLSLLWWMLCLPLMARVPAAFGISIIIAIVAGLYPRDGYSLSMLRTFTFLPFFLGGHLYGNRILVALGTYAPYKLWAVPVLGMAAAAISFLNLEEQWLYGSFTYVQLSIDVVTGAMIRTTLLFLSFASVFAFLALMSSKHCFLSAIGQRSLAVFVLHGAVVIIAQRLVANIGQPTVPWGLVLAFCASLITTFVLALAHFDAAIRWMSVSISSRILSITAGVGSLWRAKFK